MKKYALVLSSVCFFSAAFCADNELKEGLQVSESVTSEAASVSKSISFIRGGIEETCSVENFLGCVSEGELVVFSHLDPSTQQSTDIVSAFKSGSLQNMCLCLLGKSETSSMIGSSLSEDTVATVVKVVLNDASQKSFVVILECCCEDDVLNLLNVVSLESFPFVTCSSCERSTPYESSDYSDS